MGIRKEHQDKNGIVKRGWTEEEIRMLKDNYEERGIMVNNRGQSLGLIIVSSLVLLVVGLMCVNFLMPEVTNFRENMNCSSVDDISDGTKLQCLMADITIPYWIMVIFTVVIGAIIMKSNL